MPDRKAIGLSKEALFNLAGRWAAKLQALKVCAVRESNPGRSKWSDTP